MYQKIEGAIDILMFLANHSRTTPEMSDLAMMGVQELCEYIEEGYRMKPEEFKIGD